ncbi:MAG: hypothetical protein JWQ01_1561 [Massilia sp.]|nr:hypothetical protein [Massilia sp.]
MDIQYFEIMVNAMLTWSDEAKAPKKEARHATASAARDDIDDVDEFVDNIDEDDFDADEAPATKRDAAWPKSGQREVKLPEPEPAD